MDFINLHTHSDIGSVLDGLSTVEEIFKRASELGQSAISISDHGSVAALPQMLKYGEKYNVKPILACEFYVVHDDDEFFGKKQETRLHFLVTARSWEGCQSIFKKLTLANQQMFNGRPRLFYSQLFDFEECFVSLACAISLLTRPDYENIALKFKEVYGNYFYLELIHASFKMKDKRSKKEIIENPKVMPDQAKIVNLRCVELNEKHGIPLCATCDSHYTYPEQAKAFECLLAVQTRSKMSEPTMDEGGRRFCFGDGKIFIKDGNGILEDLLSLGYLEKDVILKAIKNTNVVAKHCKIKMPEFKLNLPQPYEGDDNEIFKQKIKEGFYRLGLDKKENSQAYRDRIQLEVKAITQVGFVRYFLIMEDVLRFCREKGIGVGSCRGSAGASIVALCLGIIRKIDAIEHDLIFSRFINISRVSFPDIDSDFSSERRHEVIDYLREKYGHENVSGISTYTYLSAKNAFRDVCSVHGLPSTETNVLSKLIEEGFVEEDGKKVDKYSRIESFDHVPELMKFKRNYPALFDIIKTLDGRVRGKGVHAAGIICSSIPLTDFGAVEYRKGGYCVTWDKKISEDLFFMLKLDALGLKSVDVNTCACELVSKKIGRAFTTDDIPMEDKETEEMLANGDSVAIFQFEGGNARRLLKDAGNGSLLVCSGISSANRPGVLGAKDANGVSATQHYVKRVNGSEVPEHFIPQFEEILKDSYSVLLYQEQIMKICTDVAGFTDVQADTFRKIIGKKLSREEFETHREEFVSGCTEHSNIELDKSNKIFDDFLESSSYLFNKSHAVGYAILSFESAYLKRHYPLEFFCAVLTYAGKEELLQGYIKDASRHGVEVSYPDINMSYAEKYSIFGNKIMAPLNAIKNVGDKAANFLIQARESKELDVFESHEDFLNTLTHLKLNGKCNKRVKDCLYRANAFKSLGMVVEDKQERRNNLRELLGLFSPTPSLNLKSGRGYEKKDLEKLTTVMKKCNSDNSNGSYVDSIMFSRPSVLVVLDLSKADIKLLHKTNTKWLQLHLAKRLGVPNSSIAFTSALKCSFYNVDKAKIPSECKSMCSKGFLQREVEIIRPRLIINCVSWLAKWAIDDPKAKFQETFGNSYFNGNLDAYVINMPSPQWIAYDQIIKERYEKEIIPLLESFRSDQI